ncbi:putative RING-H2 finger protein ATL69 [Durio zibethinus]|uniref:RING-type E3 ubiquitin transferase n=1 Tax=Durio zibethinus TaxID=66656 RepID=A0A6P6A910_DURZI|nr:putative RING-H2 finger protein ATL69 [Durio zibethinus]
MSLDMGCFDPFDPRFLSNTIYAAIFVVACVLCIFGLITCIQRKIERRGQSQPNAADISNSTYTLQGGNVFAKGLDKPTIEMYPTTLLGESMQLPKPSADVCPICLLEYQANEILRTIPSCMHYFHADCIDEWLKRNATCPLCRN